MTGHSGSPRPLLDPKVDIVFKALFGKQSNADLVQSLLNSILRLAAEDRIVSVQLLSPRTLPERDTIMDQHYAQWDAVRRAPLWHHRPARQTVAAERG